MSVALPPINEESWQDHNKEAAERADAQARADLERAQALQAEQDARRTADRNLQAQQAWQAATAPHREVTLGGVAQDLFDQATAPLRAAMNRPPGGRGAAGAGVTPPPFTGRSQDEASALERVYADARAVGLDEEGARVAQAVARTEKGYAGAVGDLDHNPLGAAGTFQLNFGGGQGNNYARARGISDQQARDELARDPHAGNRFALSGYLGAAIREGQAKGLRGAELATYAQRFGQRSVSPERAGANFRTGAGPPVAGAAAAVSAAPAMPAGGRIEAVGQFEQGLPYDEAAAICGPVAALAFAQANGRNPDLGEARRLARARGWTVQGGMNGVANEQRLLEGMGVASRLDTSPDFGEIAADAASGNPVIVSTPYHYYYVNGYDPATGRLRVGKTGEARKGGSAWMSAQQIAELDGGINGALFVDSPRSPTPSVAVPATQGERPESEFEPRSTTYNAILSDETAAGPTDTTLTPFDDRTAVEDPWVQATPRAPESLGGPTVPTQPTVPTVAPTRRERVRSALEGLTDALMGDEEPGRAVGGSWADAAAPSLPQQAATALTRRVEEVPELQRLAVRRVTDDPTLTPEEIRRAEEFIPDMLPASGALGVVRTGAAATAKIAGREIAQSALGRPIRAAEEAVGGAVRPVVEAAGDVLGRGVGAARRFLAEEAGEVRLGGGPPWPTERGGFDAMSVDVRQRPGWGRLVTRAGGAVTPETELIVYHATDAATAERMLAEGIDPAAKPTNLARLRYEAGEAAEYAPGRGISGDTYVGADPGDVDGYGPVTLAIRVRAGDLAPSPEQVALGSERVPADPFEALRVGDAVVAGRITPDRIRQVGEPRQRVADPFSEMKPPAAPGVVAPDIAGRLARLQAPPAANVAGAVAGGLGGYESAPEGATPLETALHVGAGALAGSAGVNVARGLARGGLPGAARSLGLETGIGREARVVPPWAARRFGGEVRVPDEEAFGDAVYFTPGAEVTPEGLRLDLTRFQKAAQAGLPAQTSGVFYTPSGHRQVGQYRGGQLYGGEQAVEGATLLRRPLAVRTRFTLTTDALADLVGEEQSGAIIRAASEAAEGLRVRRPDAEVVAAVGRVLGQHGGDASLAEHIVRSAKAGMPVSRGADSGQRVTTAVVENILAHRAREAGYDSVVSYRPMGGISEVFDLREAAYPGPAGEFALRPEFGPPAVRGGAVAGEGAGEGGQLLGPRGEPLRPTKGDVAPILNAAGEEIKRVAVRLPKPLREEFLQPEAVMPRQAVPLQRVLFDRTRNVVESMGDAGKELGQRVHAWREGAETDAAAFVERMPSVPKLSKSEFAHLVDVLEGDAKPGSAKIAQAAREVKGVLDDVYSRAANAGVDLAERIESYFPHKFKPETIREFTQGKRRAEAIRHLMATRQASNPEEAEAVLSRYAQASRNRRHGSLEMARMANLPGYEKTKEALYDHILTATRRINEVAQFGRDDAIVDRLVTRMNAEGYDGDVAHDMFKTIVGAGTPNETLARLTALARFYNSATRLGLSAVLNATQSVNTATVTGLLRTLQSMPRAAWSAEERAFADRTGVTLDTILREFREGTGWSDKLAAVSAPGFTRVERFNRRVAAIAGRDFAREMAQKAAAGDAAAKRALGKMRLDAEGIAARGGKLTPEEEITAARSIVERSQFRVDPQDLPQWASHPLGKMVAQFQTFSYGQTAFVLREVLEEAAKGNALPLVRFAVLAPLAYGAATQARDWISGRENQDDLGLRALQAGLAPLGVVGSLSRSFFGVNARYADPRERATRVLLGQLGPSAGLAVDVGGALGDVGEIAFPPKGASGEPRPLEDNWRRLGRFALRQLPLAGQVLPERLFPPERAEAPVPAGPARTRDSGRSSRDTSRNRSR